MVAVIVLAAGASYRLGRSKLLLEIEGESLLRRVVRRAVEADVGPVFVVIGPDATRSRGELSGLPCATVEDARLTSRGMNGSLAAGVSVLPSDVRGALIVLADMPFVAASTIRRLVERHAATGAPIVAACYGGEIAPPVLYDRALLPALAAGGTGDGRGRELVGLHREAAEVVDLPAWALTDVDLPGDLERVRAALRGGAER